MKNQHLKNVLELCLSTLLISVAGVLGKYISMPAAVIIWWRAFLALIILFLFCLYKKKDLKIASKKDKTIIFTSALFLGAHWVTYFYAIKVSNVSIGMLSLYTFPAITSILEPLIRKTPFNKTHLLLAILVLIGLYILVPELNIENTNVQGVFWGVFSAIIFSLRNIMLKNTSKSYDGKTVMIYQLFVVTLTISPVLFFLDTSGITTQYPYVIFLALLSTAIGHSLFVKGLKNFSASTASIIMSTQPIYGIIFAFIFLNEIPTINTFIGGTLIISTVIIESIRSGK